MQGIWPSSRVDLGYTEILRVPAVTSVPSRHVTVFLGTLCSSIMQIKVAYMFDWEQGIALQDMQGYWASNPGKGEVSWFFSSCGGNLGYILELRWG